MLAVARKSISAINPEGRAVPVLPLDCVARSAAAAPRRAAGWQGQKVRYLKCVNSYRPN